jgi:hypothetical protein
VWEGGDREIDERREVEEWVRRWDGKRVRGCVSGSCVCVHLL